MKNFVFQFESLLKYRKHRRDLCRQLLAEIMANQRRLQEKREGLEQERDGLLSEIRSLQQSDTIEVDRAAVRKYYAGQMLVDMSTVDREREMVGEQLGRCRQALVEADRDVKALEKLRDTQLERFLVTQNRRETRELDEVWMAGQLGLAQKQG